MRLSRLILFCAPALLIPAVCLAAYEPNAVDAALQELPDALPQRWEQLITAIVTVVIPAILAFFRGRKLGHDAAIDGRD